jgi:bacillithiol system protein YtxJ
MNWIDLADDQQLKEIIELSKQKTQLIFKHSTHCSISSMAKSRLERSVQPKGIDFHFLDLVKYRQLSNKIAHHFGVYHESPQILLIKNGQCIFDESHSAIMMEEIMEQATIN